ncbi:hypothetical protein CA13_28250 [Planctomycetes bacterium CA13]|uniref:Uncharacterized protein n=1 Tax=Novipirellula herctigrandis TaxID=2527986 RepID=A0A5C5Z4A0_9BACT|nr:hypothetical protein CA13_28250 [Planctomycetes bacterium CA13]
MSESAKDRIATFVFIGLVVSLSIAVNPRRSLADALVVTRAMNASTIAEIFVEEEVVRVELEIGSDDVAAFKNLLPDELYEKLTGNDRLREERLAEFFERDFVIQAGDLVLSGKAAEITAGRRIVRDEITGDPLLLQPKDADWVLRTMLVYDLEQTPENLSIQPPSATSNTIASIGFVVYHKGVAVNDFRYLSRKELLDLDWSDPWYSKFQKSNLQRRYDAPAAAFLYVENFEVRKEIVIRPKDLQSWVDLGLEGKTKISASQRDDVRTKAAEYLATQTPLQVDGQTIAGTLDRVHFINRTLKTTGVVQPGTDIDLNIAMLGAIYVYPIESLPQNVTMQWQLFDDRISRVPCVATDEAGGMPWTLDPTDTMLVWKNFLKKPTVPAFMNVAPPERKTIGIPVFTLIGVLGFGLVWAFSASPKSRPVLSTLGVITLAGATGVFSPGPRVSLSVGRGIKMPNDDGKEIAFSLLHNIYRAFDYREKGIVYDVLERSASGDLLTDIYLDTRKSLTLASQGGARVKVKAIELSDCRATPNGTDSFVANCTWMVTGSVGHWGHLHQRTNQYQGELVIKAINGEWKIIEMELTDEQRI